MGTTSGKHIFFICEPVDNQTEFARKAVSSGFTINLINAPILHAELLVGEVEHKFINQPDATSMRQSVLQLLRSTSTVVVVYTRCWIQDPMTGSINAELK